VGWTRRARFSNPINPATGKHARNAITEASVFGARSASLRVKDFNI